LDGSSSRARRQPTRRSLGLDHVVVDNRSSTNDDWMETGVAEGRRGGMIFEDNDVKNARERVLAAMVSDERGLVNDEIGRVFGAMVKEDPKKI
jgi:hypothetical protein